MAPPCMPEPAMDKATMSDFTSTEILDSEAGLPADRAARLAARRAFVEMKLLFMRAVAELSDRKGEWLRDKVRLAHDPMDLWLLRSPVLAAVQGDDRASRALRAELYRGLDNIFPAAFGLSGGMPSLPALPEPWEYGVSERPQHIAWR